MQAISLVTGKLFPEATQFLREQGCKIISASNDTTVIEYPEGTTRQELYPRTVDIRYKVMLPNGRELREVMNRVSERRALLIVTITQEEKDRLKRQIQRETIE
ncbi:MAG: hypothetical protein JO215_12255 [Ktedonobacteraceae bacterium]|nr:hypothetical protein [Ktedonobacteraceae bacterium]